MSNADLTSVLLILLLLVALAQLLGYLFTKIRQPKVIGEILAGVVLGPAIVGRFSSASWILAATQHQASILNFVYWLGLLLLVVLGGLAAVVGGAADWKHALGLGYAGPEFLSRALSGKPISLSSSGPAPVVRRWWSF